MSGVTNYAPSYLSAGLRSSEVEHYLKLHPDFLEAFAEKCSLVHNAQKCACQLSFDTHRLLPAMKHKQIDGQRFRYAAQLQRLVYRCDPLEQYELFMEAMKKLAKQKDMNNKAAKQLACSDTVVADSPSVIDTIRARYAIEHVQGSISKDLVYSLDCEAVQGASTLEVALGSVKHAAHPSLCSLPVQFSCDDADNAFAGDQVAQAPLQHGDQDAPLQDGGQTAKDAAFFAVVHAHPSRQRRVHNVTQGVGSHQIAIVLHSCLHLSSDRERAVLSIAFASSNAEHTVKLLDEQSLLAIGLVRAKESWIVWKVENDLAYNLPTLQDDSVRDCANSLVKRMVQADAIVGSDGELIILSQEDASQFELSCLKHWENEGVVVCKYDTACHSAWQLTDAGMKSMSIAYKLSSPRQVLRASCDVHRHDMSHWELLDMLLSDCGWELVVIPKRGRTPEAHAVGSGVKLFFSRRSQVAELALHVLLAQ